MREQEVRRRHVEIIVDEEGGDRSGEFVTRLARQKARAAGVRRRGGAFVGGVAAWAAKPQPAQGPSYRLVRCCRVGDRKSGVWGKSGSVMVDMGGRRSIKQKT